MQSSAKAEPNYGSANYSDNKMGFLFWEGKRNVQKQFERTQVGWGFWLWWVLASAVGYVAGFPQNFLVAGVAVAVLWGAVVGVSQWLVLRGKISRAGWWVLASTVGWFVGLFVGSVVGRAVGELVFGLDLPMVVVRVGAGAGVGVVVGASQWLVLRGKISQAGWWVLASTVGSAVGFAVADAVGFDMGFIVHDPVGLVVGGAVAGCITGGALVWLLRHRIPDAADVSPIQKTVLVLIAILTVLFVIFVMSGGDQQAVGCFEVFAIASLPGILLSLITLIPAVRKRAQSSLAGRVVTLLVVMILSVVVVFFVTTRLQVIVWYAVVTTPQMGVEIHYDYPRQEFVSKYFEKRSAIVHETWIRVIVPPPLRQQCYTTEKDVCEFVDQFPEIRRVLFQNYLQGVFFPLVMALVGSLPGGALAWYFTRRKYPQEVVIEVSDEKK